MVNVKRVVLQLLFKSFYRIWRFRVFNSSSKSTGYFICRWGSIHFWKLWECLLYRKRKKKPTTTNWDVNRRFLSFFHYKSHSLDHCPPFVSNLSWKKHPLCKQRKVLRPLVCSSKLLFAKKKKKDCRLATVSTKFFSSWFFSPVRFSHFFRNLSWNWKGYSLH